MSLEQLLKENTEATLAQNELLAKLLENSGGVATGGTTTSTSSDDTSEEAPKRERGKPSAGKSKRTAAEVAEDKAADEADAAAAAGSDDGDGTVTFDSLKVKLANWLGQFAVEADKEKPEGTHPEVLARKAALKAVLNKLTGTDDGKLGAISDDADKIAKLDNWFEEKALKADKGHGIGRLAADPEETTSSDDDLDI